MKKLLSLLIFSFTSTFAAQPLSEAYKIDFPKTDSKEWSENTKTKVLNFCLAGKTTPKKDCQCVLSYNQSQYTEIQFLKLREKMLLEIEKAKLITDLSPEVLTFMNNPAKACGLPITK